LGYHFRTRYFKKPRFSQAERLLPKWLVCDEREVAATQLERLKQVWQDAVANIPYYAEMVKRGEAPAHITSFAMFRETIPISTRAALKAKSEQLLRRDPPHHVLATSGSTGNPFQLGVFRDEGEINAINQIAGQMANGLAIDDRTFWIWGHAYTLGGGIIAQLKRIERWLKDKCLNYIRVSAYHLDPQSIGRYIYLIRRAKPQVVLGYSTALDLLARSGLSLEPDWNIKFVLATAEKLPFPDSRAVISAYFGAPVIMEYGAVDFGVVSYERRINSLSHVFWWSHYVEASDNGEIIVTPLYRRYLPLIRYATGDEASEWRYFEHGAVREMRVSGRLKDLIELSDGSVIHRQGVFHCIHHIRSIKGAQLITKDGRYTLSLISDPLTAAEIESIQMRLKNLNPALWNIPIESVDDLQTNRAGKRNWVIR
jgi:phenylacetate-CoA ligase